MKSAVQLAQTFDRPKTFETDYFLGFYFVARFNEPPSFESTSSLSEKSL